MTPPSLRDVYRARARLKGVLPETPLARHPLAGATLGCDVWIKHENHLPTGAFKVRGGLNLMLAEAEAGPLRPVVTASTGNHGQSIAYACQRLGVQCRVYVPRGNNPDKNAAMRAWGAEVVEHGRDFDEAREEVERIAIGRHGSLHPLGRRAAAHCGRRHLRAGDLRGAARGRGGLRPDRRRQRRVGARDGSQRAGRAGPHRRRPGGGRRRLRPLVADRHARPGRADAHVCRGHCDACHLRPAVRHPLRAEDWTISSSSTKTSSPPVCGWR